MVNVEKLIEEVQKFPVLYNQWHEKYRNAEHKERVWKYISDTVKAKGGVEECKKKWTSVRDQLRRTLNKRKTGSGSDQMNRKYKYEDLLQFLVPHVNERDSFSNVLIPEVNHEVGDYETKFNINTQEELSEECLRNRNEQLETNIEIAETDNVFRSPSSNSKTRVKRKLSTVDSPEGQLMAYILSEKEKETKRSKNSVHPVDVFLSAISPTLKTLNPILQNQAKSRIFSIVQEFEMKQLMNSHSHTLSPSPSFDSFSPPPSTSQSITSPLQIENEYY